MYKVIKNIPFDGIETILFINETTTLYIPSDPSNNDYQQYLAWLEEGNIPEEWNPEVNNNG